MDQTKKRKRDSGHPRITYHAATRTFDRLFKEDDLDEMKEVVRRKLDLDPGTVIRLAQLRAGKPIDLEDDDDFDAFYAVAHATSAAEVQVTVGRGETHVQATNVMPQDAAISNEEKQGAEGATKSRKRKVAPIQTPNDNEKGVTTEVPKPKKRKGNHGTAAQSSAATHNTVHDATGEETLDIQTEATPPEAQHPATKKRKTRLSTSNDASFAEGSTSSNPSKDASKGSGQGSSTVQKAVAAEESTSSKSKKAKTPHANESATAQEAEEHEPVLPEEQKKPKRKARKSNAAVASTSLVEPSEANADAGASSSSKPPGPSETLAEPSTKPKRRKSRATTGKSDDTSVPPTASAHATKNPAATGLESISNGKSTVKPVESTESSSAKIGKKGKNKKKKDDAVEVGEADDSSHDSIMPAPFILADVKATMRKLIEIQVARSVAQSAHPSNDSASNTSRPSLSPVVEPAVLSRTRPTTASAATTKPRPSLPITGQQAGATAKKVNTSSLPSSLPPSTAQTIPKVVSNLLDGIPGGRNGKLIPSKISNARKEEEEESSSTSDSDDDDAAIHTRPTIPGKLPQRPAPILPYADVDLASLVRGPKRPRLTLDQVLSANIVDREEENDEPVALEEEDFINSPRRRRFISLAESSESDNDSDAFGTPHDDRHSPEPIASTVPISVISTTPSSPKAGVLPIPANSARTGATDTKLVVKAPTPVSPAQRDESAGPVMVPATAALPPKQRRASSTKTPTLTQNGVPLHLPRTLSQKQSLKQISHDIPPHTQKDQPSATIDSLASQVTGEHIDDPIASADESQRHMSPIENEPPSTPRSGLVQRMKDRMGRLPSRSPGLGAMAPPSRRPSQNDTMPSQGICIQPLSPTALPPGERDRDASRSPSPTLGRTKLPKTPGMLTSMISGIPRRTASLENATPLATWTILADGGSLPEAFQDTDSSIMVDELRSSPQAQESQKGLLTSPKTNSSHAHSNRGSSPSHEPLFIHTSSQAAFPYSQWQSIPPDLEYPSSPKGNGASPNDSDDEDEVAAAVKTSRITRPIGTYRKLTDIASQPTLFSTPPPVLKPASFARPGDTRDMYGSSARDDEDDESDSDTDSDEEAVSHIPKSRRAGAIR